MTTYDFVSGIARSHEAPLNAGSQQAPFVLPVSEKGDGSFANAGAQDPFFIQTNSQAIAEGEIDGYSAIHKFGSNADVDTTKEDVWNVGGLETLLATPATMWIACEDDTDDTQVIRVSGLDANWDEITVNVTLDGQTPVQIGEALNWLRVSRAYQVSAAPSPADNVWIARDDTDFTLGVPQTAANIHALVGYAAADIHNQTLKCMLTVPAGKKLLIHEIGARMLQSLGTRRTVEVHLEVQELAEGATVLNPSWAPFRAIRELVLDSEITVADQLLFPFPLICPQLTNVHMKATATAATDVRASIDAFLAPANS